MEERISTRLSPSGTGKKFGLTIGCALLVVAVVRYWRGSHTSAEWLVAVGAALIVAAITVPGWLEPSERVWMAGAALLSKVTTPIFMGVIYFLVFTPTGIVRRMFGRTALARKAPTGSFWIRRAEGARKSDLERQF